MYIHTYFLTLWCHQWWCRPNQSPTWWLCSSAFSSQCAQPSELPPSPHQWEWSAFIARSLAHRRIPCGGARTCSKNLLYSCNMFCVCIIAHLQASNDSKKRQCQTNASSSSKIIVVVAAARQLRGQRTNVCCVSLWINIIYWPCFGGPNRRLCARTIYKNVTSSSSKQNGSDRVFLTSEWSAAKFNFMY